ncbi:O-methyltransferase [bacterium SCSIO 12741]|nr:O-methyltransferase [bacterium SCSIO 12741]
MEFLDPILDDYVVRHSADEPDLLKNLNRETHLKVLIPRMIAGHYQGRVLSMLSFMIRPRVVLEIGTYTGYSAMCFAEGMPEDGVVHTIDHNEELQDIQDRYFEQCENRDKIKRYIGTAAKIIDDIEGNFDLVYIDADKENYAHYFDQVIDRMNPGGYIIADNVLWSGKVLEEAAAGDQETQALQAYNMKIKKDPRVDNVLLPIRDGLMVARVK